MAHTLELKEICKEFSGNQVLKNVTMHFDRGEVVALVGHNGAGKSTIMNIMDGVLTPTSGSICVEGQEKHFQNPRQAARSGICMVHQEICLFDHLTVWENMFIHELKTRHGLMDKEEMVRECERRTREMGIYVDPQTKVGTLPVATKQMIEICREVGTDGKILILDEPSSSIGREEVANLFTFIRKVKKEKNMCIIYISHRLDEIIEISDRIYALRAGILVADRPTSETTVKDLAEIILGEKKTEGIVHEKCSREEAVLTVRGLCSELLQDVSFTLHKGEVLGLCGLIGSGRSEIMRSIYGCQKYDRGEITGTQQKKFGISPKRSIADGIAFASEDRKAEGMFLDQDVEFNVATQLFSKHKKYGVFVDEKKIGEIVKEAIESLKIKVFNKKQIVKTLSGGNQQKVVLARCLSSHPEVILLDEPTRGIDISAKEEIFSIVRRLAKQGCGVIFVSSDFSELLRVCDRVLYMKNGICVGEEEVTEQLTENKMLVKATEGSRTA